MALDKKDWEQASPLLRTLGNRIDGVKIHRIWDELGAKSVSMIRDLGVPDAWVDLKLFDTPDTAAERAEQVKKAGAKILTVHAKGEVEMMMAAVKNGPELVLAITELTSLTAEQVEVGGGLTPKSAVLHWARVAKLGTVGGVVTSALEVGMLSKRPELKGFVLAVPGTRSAGVDVNDQKRSDTPYNAVLAGAGLIVAGRQVTAAEDPVTAIEALREEVNKASDERLRLLQEMGKKKVA
ncbi:MAG: orotidine-5'-phosphate decarboxylase [Candidatus Pacebacteria bacterium]|nr:orotidine-5'-phosphate decarboxylase [Candidatus Paceibacterota bacterium]